MSSTASAASSGGGSNSLSDMKRHACSSFLAGEEPTSIVPLFSHPKPLSLLGHSQIGPFTAGVDVAVPLWLALFLQRRHLCKIVPPQWLDVEFLKKILKYEQESDSFSEDLPYHYQSMARSLLAVCDESTTANTDAIRILLQDIETVRLDKIRRNIQSLSQHTLTDPKTLPMVQVTGIGAMELAAIQPFVAQAFHDHLYLSRKEESIDEKQKNASADETRRQAMGATTTTKSPSSSSSSSSTTNDEPLETPTAASTAASTTTTSRLRRFR